MILPWKNSWLGWRSTKSSTFFRSIVTDPIDRRSISRFNEPGDQAFNLLMLLLSSNFLLLFLFLLPPIPRPLQIWYAELAIDFKPEIQKTDIVLAGRSPGMGLGYAEPLLFASLFCNCSRVLRDFESLFQT